MKRELAEDTSFHDERNHWELGEWCVTHESTFA